MYILCFLSVECFTREENTELRDVNQSINKINCLSIEFKGRPSVNSFFTFYSCDLDLDPVTLIYKHDLNILKMYLRAKN